MIDKNWLTLIKPEKLDIQSLEKGNKARFSVAPLERGFGLTLGNSLRRVLLSSLQGVAVNSIRIKNILHEFSSIPGVVEDVTHIVLNIKNLYLKSLTGSSSTLSIKVKGPKVITAADISSDHNISVINKDLVICEVLKGYEFEMDLHVAVGKGYVAAEAGDNNEKPVDVILIDSIFSPVLRVTYKIESARVGQVTNYDKLILDVVTNGSISPENAVGLAARILQDQFSIFVNFVDPISKEQVKKEEELPFHPFMLKRIDDLEFSVRSANCLKTDNINFIGDLVQRSEIEMLRKPNFGRKSLNEIKDLLNKMGLHLGMQITDWPPKNLEELAKKLEDNF